MNEIEKTPVLEINCAEENWMFQLGRMARAASKVIVKDFRPNCANNAFVQAISQHHNLSFYPQDNDLVFEKRATFLGKTA